MFVLKILQIALFIGSTPCLEKQMKYKSRCPEISIWPLQPTRRHPPPRLIRICTKPIALGVSGLKLSVNQPTKY